MFATKPRGTSSIAATLTSFYPIIHLLFPLLRGFGCIVWGGLSHLLYISPVALFGGKNPIFKRILNYFNLKSTINISHYRGRTICCCSYINPGEHLKGRNTTGWNCYRQPRGYSNTWTTRITGWNQKCRLKCRKHASRYDHRAQKKRNVKLLKRRRF